MKNIHLIRTDKPTGLFKLNGKLQYSVISKVRSNNEGYHIYITNSEEIKEGDYSFYPPFGIGKNIVIDGELCFHIEAKDGKGSFTQRTYQTLDRNRKIILTTDVDIIKDGVQAIDNEFLEWFVKNPSCEEVEVTEDSFFGYRPIIFKQETLEEAAERLAKEHCSLRINTNTTEFQVQELIIKGAKYQAERMYSEEDMLKCWNAAYIDAMSLDNETYKPLFFEDFIKQLKNK